MARMAVRGKATPKRITKENCSIILYYAESTCIAEPPLVLQHSWAVLAPQIHMPWQLYFTQHSPAQPSKSI